VVISPFKASATVVVFVSTICPISDKCVERLNELHRAYSGKGVQVLAVNPNANETWQQTQSYAEANRLLYPVYRDEWNRLADKLDAHTTPEAFVIDRQGLLRYRGRIDDATNPARVRVHWLKDAIEAVVSGASVAAPRTRGLGCAIHRANEANK
jgi:peroxiredoxin